MGWILTGKWTLLLMGRLISCVIKQSSITVRHSASSSSPQRSLRHSSFTSYFCCLWFPLEDNVMYIPLFSTSVACPGPTAAFISPINLTVSLWLVDWAEMGCYSVPRRSLFRDIKPLFAGYFHPRRSDPGPARGQEEWRCRIFPSLTGPVCPVQILYTEQKL